MRIKFNTKGDVVSQLMTLSRERVSINDEFRLVSRNSKSVQFDIQWDEIRRKFPLRMKLLEAGGDDNSSWAKFSLYTPVFSVVFIVFILGLVLFIYQCILGWLSLPFMIYPVISALMLLITIVSVRLEGEEIASNIQKWISD